MRRSIQSTYDSRQTGPAYHVTYRMNDKTITFQEPIDDPFIRGRVTIGFLDLLRGLLRRHIIIEVIVSGDKDRVDDVLELDENALISRSSRRLAFNVQLQNRMSEDK